MSAPKYIVWMHHNPGSSTGTAPMTLAAATRMQREEEESIATPMGLPQWPKIEIRRDDNPPAQISSPAEPSPPLRRRLAERSSTNGGPAHEPR